ncbi:hypothetical protein H6783_03875 [Candidatus Nomurabacteria bacterium]|nr:hypothetical protein [Candidatus Nomurabacteria bacterium]
MFRVATVPVLALMVALMIFGAGHFFNVVTSIPAGYKTATITKRPDTGRYLAPWGEEVVKETAETHAAAENI